MADMKQVKNPQSKKWYKRKSLIALLVAVALVTAAVTLAVRYVSDYYPATRLAENYMTKSYYDGVTIETVADNAIAFVPAEPRAGLIFYPGGKVDHRAYAPLLQELASKGVLAVLVEMPLRLAVLDQNAAADVREELAEQYPAVTDWYLGGHSLGGSMAAAHAAKNTDSYRGVILLASYSTKDLTDSGLRVLTVRGGSDGILDEGKYHHNLANLPEGYVERVLPGANHAGFGSYGHQPGDNIAELLPAAQWSITVLNITNFLFPEEADTPNNPAGDTSDVTGEETDLNTDAVTTPVESDTAA